MARMWKEGSRPSGLPTSTAAAKHLGLPLPRGRWNKVIDSGDAAWDGPGSLLPGRLDERHGADLVHRRLRLCSVCRWTE